MRGTVSLLLLLALLIVLPSAGCRTDDDPARVPSSTQIAQAAEVPGWEAGVAATGAEVRVQGAQTFRGGATFRCVLHGETGLQVDFRTGDPALPVVVVRIEDYRGAGPYSGVAFVTARTSSGALATSQGDARLTVEQRSADPATPDLLVVRGSFSATYRGAAGSGSLEGRFGECSYARTRTVPVAPAPGALPTPEPAEGPDVGEDAPMP